MDVLTMPPMKLPNSAGRVLGDLVELLDGVHAGRVANQVVGYLVVVHAVQDELLACSRLPFT